MEKCEKTEKDRLLSENNMAENVKLNHSKWLTYLIVISMPLLHICSYILSLLVLNQYTYYAFMNEKYPNSTDKTETLPGCSADTDSVEYKQQVDVQKIAAEWSMYCNLAYLLPSVFVNMNLATYSDVYGRKLFFIIPLAGAFLKAALSSVGIFFEINIRLLLIFNMIEASTGSWIATLSMSICFIADTSEAGKSRSFLIGVLEGGLGLGGLIATFLSGYLIKWTNGYFYPEVIASVLLGIALIIALTLVQESLPKSSRRQHASIKQNMIRVVQCYRPNFSPNVKPWVFITLITMFAMSAFSNLSRANVETLYKLNTPFCWDSVQIGVFSAVRACLWNLGGLVIIKLFHICTTDEVIALFGLLTTIGSLTIQGLAQTGLMLYVSAVASIGCTMTMPMVRAIMSRITPSDKQGSVFAGIATVEVISALVGAVGMNAVYNSTVDIYRGLTFLVWTAFGCVGVVLSIILIAARKQYVGNVEKENSIKVGYTNVASDQSKVTSKDDEIGEERC